MSKCKLPKGMKRQLKINQNSTQQEPERFSFSFLYITKNKNHNFQYLEKSDAYLWKAALYDKLVEISKESWRELWAKDKHHGLESIKYEQLNFSPYGISISSDTKLIVLRFNSQKGRVIGFKREQTFHIIGFDIDYSAYNHG